MNKFFSAIQFGLKIFLLWIVLFFLLRLSFIFFLREFLIDVTVEEILIKPSNCRNFHADNFTGKTVRQNFFQDCNCSFNFRVSRVKFRRSQFLSNISSKFQSNAVCRIE